MSKKVSAYSRFVADPDEPSTILQWFRDEHPKAEEVALDWGVALHFHSCGSLQYNTDGSIDGTRSPLVGLRMPRVRRQILWTVGEVVFYPTPLSQFPELALLRRSFLRWFGDLPLIYDHHPAGPHEFDYYLEAGAGNWGPIRAFPSGLSALRAGRYFIPHQASDTQLSTLCKTLRLRDVHCGEDG